MNWIQSQKSGVISCDVHHGGGEEKGEEKGPEEDLHLHRDSPNHPSFDIYTGTLRGNLG